MPTDAIPFDEAYNNVGIAQGTTSASVSIPSLSTVYNSVSDPTATQSLTAGYITGDISSANFQTGVAGWKLSYLGDFEGNTGVFRGNITASNINLTGGSISYQKTSFSDSTNSGYYISPLGIYFGSASDVTKLKFTIADGSFDYIGTISGRSTGTLATAIDAAGHFADSAISTATGTIITPFTFGVSGALQIGTYVNGVSGDLRISPNGILARNSTGATTFSIDGATGIAVLNGLVVGTNVGIGTAQTAGQVTTIVGDTVTTSFVNALAVTAGSVSANNITAGTIIGSTLETAASVQRVVISGSDNSLRFYDSVGQVIGIGTDAGYAINISGTSGTNFGVNMTSSIAGVGYRYYNSANVNGYGIDLYLTGATNAGACIRMEDDGTTGSFGILGTFTNGAVPFYLTKSGTGNMITLNNSASGNSIGILSTGNTSAASLDISNTASTASPVGIKLIVNASSSGSPTGIYFNMETSGGRAAYAFDFEGSEVVNSAVVGTQNRKIKVLIGGNVYFIPAYDG